MTYLTIVKEGDSYEIISKGERDEIVVMIATAITKDPMFQDAFDVAQAFFDRYGKGDN